MSEKPTYEELEQRVRELEQTELDGQQTQEALRENEEKLNLIIETSPVGIGTVDSLGNFITTNLSYERMVGYSKKELIGLSIFDVTHPDHRPKNKKLFQDMFSLKTGSFFIEKKYIHKNGEIIEVAVHATGVMDAEGNIKFGTAFVEDITKRKQAEDALIKSEELYKSAQRIAKVGHWEFDLKTEKFWGSDESRRIYGFDPQRANATTDEIEQCIPDRQRVHQALLDLIENGHPYNLEFEIQPLGGPEKKYIKSIAEVVVNEAGIPEKVDGVILDITEQKLADQKLRKSEERYRQLFNSIRDTILVTDTDRNIIDCNQTFTKVFGYTKEELIGRKTNFLYDNEDEYLEMGKELKSHLNESHFAYVINYRKKSGEIMPGETSAIYLENDKGEIIGFIGITRDITYRKMFEESLQKANDGLICKTVELEDMNTALKVLLKKRDQDNLEIQENIYSNYELMIIPFLRKIKNRSAEGSQQNLLDIIETNLNEIVTPFTKKLSSPMMSLTSSEIQIANMIKQGFTNKEIARTLNCSKRTIDTHRENIREKLDLTNKKINLKTFLSNL